MYYFKLKLIGLLQFLACNPVPTVECIFATDSIFQIADTFKCWKCDSLESSHSDLDSWGWLNSTKPK